jgi:hypothetical protein
MRLTHRPLGLIFSFFLIILGFSCAVPPQPKVLSPVEQIAVDTERAGDLAKEFKKRVRFISSPRLERFLSRMAQRIAQASKDFPLDQIEVRIHDDSDPELRRSFSFPGTLISVPLGFLKKVEFENELGAMLSYEVANVVNRHLANRVEAAVSAGKGSGLVLFGEGSVFVLDQVERAKSIVLGTDFLYWSGYDVRGMASVFQRYPGFFGKPDSDLDQKEVNFNIREAQRARSDLLPSLKPTVRSAEFIQFKKELERVR